MKLFTKALLLTLTLTLLCMLLSFSTLANDQEDTIIVVSETQNPSTGAPYTLEEAWAVAEGTERVEVILKTDNEGFTDNLALVNVEGKKTTLRLTEETTTTATTIVEKNCTLKIDLYGFTLNILHQIGIRSFATLSVVSSEMGGRLENLMTYPLFDFASDANLVLGGEENVLTLKGAKAFKSSEFSANISASNVHFDGVSLNIADTSNLKIQIGQGCTFDMGNQDGINEWGNGFTYPNIEIQDGYVLARTEQKTSFAILEASEVVDLTFILEEESILVHYERGAKVHPQGGGVTINGNYYYLQYNKEVQESAQTNETYRVHYTGGAQLSGNYTLNTAIDFHAYIPATDEITHINDVRVSKLETVLVNRERHYKISFPNLAPKNAYETQTVSLTVKLGSKVVTVDRYVSLLGYAESAIKNKLSKNILDLIFHTLDYINKANMYFGGESVERINDLLKEQNFTPYQWEEKNVQEIGKYENLRGACLDLSQTPGFVFYVRADYEGTITVNDKVYQEYSDPVTVAGEQLKYIVLKIPAYQMTNNLTVVAGEDTLVYNLDTYIAGKAPTEPYAHAFYGYVIACKNYVS